LFDNILHQAIRSKLIALLIQNEQMPFIVLKKTLELTDGNLSSHLKKLEEAKYINIEKTFEGKKPKTMVQISSQGRDAFKKYIKQLEQFIKDN